MESITRFLERRLKLADNQGKSKAASTHESVFFGFIFKDVKIRCSDKAFAEFKRRIKRLTGRIWGVSMEYRFARLAEYLRGWMGYFGISEYYHPLPEIDHWLRRRVRMCYLKQWRRCRTKFRELTRLGVNLRLVVFIGLSRKGSYRRQDAGNPVGDDQPMAEGSGFVVCQRTVGEHPFPRYGAVAHGNRLVRTCLRAYTHRQARMLCGVGTGGRRSPGYPIRRIQFFLIDLN